MAFGQIFLTSRQKLVLGEFQTIMEFCWSKVVLGQNVRPIHLTNKELNTTLTHFKNPLKLSRMHPNPKFFNFFKFVYHFWKQMVLILYFSYASNLNSHLSTILLAQIGVSAPIICVCAYQFAHVILFIFNFWKINTNEPKIKLKTFLQIQQLSSTQLAFLFPYAFAMVLQVFAPNYLGTTVVENCKLLSENAFSSDWFELKLVEKRNFLIFITRLLHPLVVRGGRFFEINITTFLKVFKNNLFV